MDESRFLIGVDSCVLIEAVRLRERIPSYPSVRLFDYMAVGAFILLLLEDVDREVRRVLAGSGEEAKLEELLSLCEVKHCPPALREQVIADGALFLPHLRHLNDVPIAVALRDCLEKPHFFLSSNKEHWKPSLRDILGGIEVLTVKAFLTRLGM